MSRLGLALCASLAVNMAAIPAAALTALAYHEQAKKRTLVVVESCPRVKRPRAWVI